MPVWGHAWVQPASALEQALAGQDGVVHAAGFAGELFSGRERDTLVADGNFQVATAEVATVGSAHDPKILAALDSHGPPRTVFRADTGCDRQSVAYFNAKRRHIPSEQEEYVRAASGFGMEVTREAVRRGVPISAGSDHVAYGPAKNEQLCLESCSCWSTRSHSLLEPRCWRQPVTLPGHWEESRADGLASSRRAATPTWCSSSKNPLRDIGNLDSVEWIMRGGRIWRPGQLRSGIAMR